MVHSDRPKHAYLNPVLHLTEAEGGFGVTFNDITKDAATTSRFVT